MQYFLPAAAAVLGIVSIAVAHTGQRVWVDVDASGNIVTLEGPLGGIGLRPASEFTPSRVFTRDLGNPSDDEDDNTYSVFPGYEKTQHPATNFNGTFHFNIAGEVLYYKPTGFVPVSTQFLIPAETPRFVIENEDGSDAFASTTGFVSGGVAFSTGGHGHPLNILDLPAPYTGSQGPDLYDGVYALPLNLQFGSATSPTFYLLFGRNEDAATLTDADALANLTLVPEPTSIAFVGGVAAMLLRRKRERV